MKAKGFAKKIHILIIYLKFGHDLGIRVWVHDGTVVCFFPL